jgi:hypothetical protein
MQQPQYHWKRRFVQIATIITIVLIPASGLFRINLTTDGTRPLFYLKTVFAPLAAVFIHSSHLVFR